MSRVIIIAFILTFSVKFIYASDSTSRDKSVYFIQPEFLIGKTLPAHSDFPDTRVQTAFAVSFGRYVTNPNKDWAVFFNYPSVGITFSKTSFGQDQILGNAYSLLPFLSINLSKKPFNSIHLKLGLGASYFTSYYHTKENPDNKAIGSKFTWTFQTSIHYNILVTRQLALTAGAGFIHHSNGHTKLPNLGLNSFLFSFSAKIYLSPLDDNQKKEYPKPSIDKTKQYFISFRTGLGIHEFGDERQVMPSLKKAVYSFAASGGIVIKRLIKVRIGVAYRFYQHYYNYITQYKSNRFESHPMINASNIFLYVGCELLLGHIGIDSELGINIYKPFYREHSNLIEDDGEFSYMLKRTIATRLGMKLYAINTSKNPRNNFFLGAYINANMGQADFSELTIGLVHRIKRRHDETYPPAF